MIELLERIRQHGFNQQNARWPNVNEEVQSLAIIMRIGPKIEPAIRVRPSTTIRVEVMAISQG